MEPKAYIAVEEGPQAEFLALALKEHAVGMDESNLLACTMSQAFFDSINAEMLQNWPALFAEQIGRVGLRLKYECEEMLLLKPVASFALSAHYFPKINDRGEDLCLAVMQDRYERNYTGCFPAFHPRVGSKDPNEMSIFRSVGTYSTLQLDKIRRASSAAGAYEPSGGADSVIVKAMRCVLESRWHSKNGKRTD